jgi:hypothetical protein
MTLPTPISSGNDPIFRSISGFLALFRQKWRFLGFSLEKAGEMIVEWA